MENKLIGRMRTKLMMEATVIIGIKSSSEITVRIRAMLTGVLITPTVMAAMVQTMATEGAGLKSANSWPCLRLHQSRKSGK